VLGVINYLASLVNGTVDSGDDIEVSSIRFKYHHKVRCSGIVLCPTLGYAGESLVLWSTLQNQQLLGRWQEQSRQVAVEAVSGNDAMCDLHECVDDLCHDALYSTRRSSFHIDIHLSA